jgi:hypothetical protein
MDRDTARIIGGLYYAITSALPRETAEQIHQIVLGYDNPHNSSAEREYYRALAATVLELFDDPLERRNRFHVISGGSAA